MTVRRRVFLILSLFIILLLSVVSSITPLALLRTAEAQDGSRVEDNVRRLRNALEAELAGLDRQGNDYAAWDDTYAFIQKPSPAYLASNIAPSTFENSRFRFLVFLTTSGRIVHQSAYDTEAGAAIPMPPGLEDHLGAGSPLFRRPDLRTGVKGLLVLGGQPYMVASRPILTSNDEGPAAGTLVVGRILDKNLIDSFGRALLLPLTLEAGGSSAAGPAATGGDGVVVRPLDRRRLEGRAVFVDLYGRPAAAVSFPMERVFRIQFLGASRILMISLLAFVVISLAAVLILLDRQVIGRLFRLHRFVRDVERSSDLGRRIDIAGADEVGQLAAATNTLLATLEENTARTQEAEAQARASETKYAALFDASPDGILLETPEDRILAANKSAILLLGYSRSELTAMNGSDLLIPEHRSMIAALRARLKEEKRALVKLQALTKAGERIPVEAALQTAVIGGETRVVIYVRDQRRQEKSEAARAVLYEISQAASGAASLDDLYALFGRRIFSLFPFPNFYIALLDEEARKVTFPLFFDEVDASPGSRPIARGLTEYVFRTKEPLLVSGDGIRALHRSGEVEPIGQTPVDWLGVPLKTEEAIIGVMAIQSYRPDRRIREEDKDLLLFLSSQVAMAIDRVRSRERLQASLAEKESLLREIHHRVKNNLQIVSSLLHLQAGSVRDAAALESLRESQARIRSMSLVHEKLYRSPNLARIQLSDYVQSLAVSLFESLRSEAGRIRLHFDLEPIVLDINTAIPIGLIVNELLSNALKHAFPGGRAGTIKVELRSRGPETHELAVEDDGIGLPAGIEPSSAGTLGLQLIQMLAEQLDGTVRREAGPGARFAVLFREAKARPRA